MFQKVLKFVLPNADNLNMSMIASLTSSTGYTPCVACNMEVIGVPLCVYCDETRVEQGMPEFADLTPNQLDTLCAIAFAEEEADTATDPFLVPLHED